LAHSRPPTRILTKMTPEDHNSPTSSPLVERTLDEISASRNEAPILPVDLDPTLPQDLRVPWGWFDLVILIVLMFVGGILLTFALMWIFGRFGFTWKQIQASAKAQSVFLIVTTMILSSGVLLYLAAQMRILFRAPIWRTLGWRPIETYRLPRPVAYVALIVGGMSLSLVVSLISTNFAAKTKLPIQDLLQDPWTAFFFLLLSVSIGPVFEETVFRGYIYPVVARSFGIPAGIVITGAIFGLLHAPQLWGGWSQIGLLIFVGIVFTAARAISRTVVASYLLHVSYNSFLFIAFLVASHGLRQLPVGPQ
jgi:uncharacterized protein